MSLSEVLYKPIKPYQTRLIRLYYHNGIPNSQLICDLLTADILHTRFNGIGVRSVLDDGDSILEYEALSYTWGSNHLTKTIKCNNIDVWITETLFQALKALRFYPTFKTGSENFRYLWVDALCINQKDDSEKSEQVWNMLTIFQKATRVIGWLGIDSKYIRHALNATTWLGSNTKMHELPYNVIDCCGSVLKGLSDLYGRSWFGRIWVQQEVFAAEKIILQFELSSLLSVPRLLVKIHNKLTTRLRKHSRSGIFFISSEPEACDRIRVQLDAILKLNKVHAHELNCFKQFSKPDYPNPDFIEALLDTGRLQATNPKDYIYGIIGMTGFPVKPMLLHEWKSARRWELFIPIDYSMDINALLSVITWVLLMKCGLAILAKFKAFDLNNDGGLPSWAIDWRLAAKLFNRDTSTHYRTSHRIENSWSIRRSHDLLDHAYKDELTEFHLIQWPAPPAHRKFKKDNMTTELPHTKLILRGKIETQFLIGERSISRNYQPYLKDKVIWHLEHDVYPTDLVVYMLGFVGVGYQGSTRVDIFEIGNRSHTYESGGLWILRPVGEEFKLISCLTWDDEDYLSLYRHWKWNKQDSQESLKRYRRFSRKESRSNGILSGILDTFSYELGMEDYHDPRSMSYTYDKAYLKFQEIRKFVII
ncbi:hypothetical protein BCON_0114g00220 [Botryotinia convoluta]|uniref:Heterokaryon incompatibility domain-containing protein n=1 Tax=Botryotinia convoluta TaxID=54673 RepID=A0A4Z1HY50_9HELO|nr:hypothetical protein BCON_0114g00220 [Botryotinia convoluta]